MNIDIGDLESRIAANIPVIAKLVEKCLAASAEHGPGSTVSMHLKIQRDPDCPNNLELHAVAKTKHPKSKLITLTARTEDELIAVFKIDEAPGQQRLAGT